ncbi:MAG TPA: DUF5666 domain-containing protein [Candidatus Polarisedimenticolia bacterium]|nr:DUF5666 domain-containing protein [Candidatus Polarisedimenticolia bacterium]
MRKIVAIILGTAVLLAAAPLVEPGALAEGNQTRRAAKPDPDTVRGTITDWNDGAKTFKVRDESGQEVSLVWDDGTKIHGTARVGETVMVKHKKDKDGRMVAKVIKVGADRKE